MWCREPWWLRPIVLTVETETSWPRWRTLSVFFFVFANEYVAPSFIWKERSLHHAALLLVAPQNDVVALELGASAVVHGSGLDRQRLTWSKESKASKDIHSARVPTRAVPRLQIDTPNICRRIRQRITSIVPVYFFDVHCSKFDELVKLLVHRFHFSF
jgi:hypothetical protein